MNDVYRERDDDDDDGELGVGGTGGGYLRYTRDRKFQEPSFL